MENPKPEIDYSKIPPAERWWHLPGEVPWFSTVRVTIDGPLKGRIGTVVDDWRTPSGKQVGAYHIEFFDRDLLLEAGYDEHAIKSGAGVVHTFSANNIEIVWRFGDPKPVEMGNPSATDLPLNK